MSTTQQEISEAWTRAHKAWLRNNEDQRPEYSVVVDFVLSLLAPFEQELAIARENLDTLRKGVEQLPRTNEVLTRRVADIEAAAVANKETIEDLRKHLREAEARAGAIGQRRYDEMTHELKTWPAYFAAIQSGDLTGCVRNNDRKFKVGDLVLLREWKPDQGYTSQSLLRRITHVLVDLPGIAPGFAGLSFGPPGVR